ncbi:Crp/Fnr family transcriptional regulator [Dysgonomonas sp. BGC7]|uniref:Crp/Fnr family transcriptional regulator n=1 Tax=Dysgonomonas sp. BGC7 TaxID=1658008 RepID=UPI0006816971|nr:Crp/Fnr family transcriptional regulator [Dysgonomonas sp. BGC7]MBD8387236.1 Crp/Fnr family transcriptional regulator [Dysgonomonas sp. BGC7]
MHEQLIKDISIKYKIQVSDIELSKRLFQPVLMPKNRILEEEGKIPLHLYYIVSGFMRLFYYSDSGDEVTTHINCPHGFFTSFSEFTNQTKSSVNVETVTECQLLRITKQDYDTLMSESLFWKDYGMHVLQESLIYNEERSKDLATLSAEQRYLKLMKSHPDILQNVPLQYIASFLGIKPESLSRIRRNLIN